MTDALGAFGGALWSGLGWLGGLLVKLGVSTLVLLPGDGGELQRQYGFAALAPQRTCQSTIGLAILSGGEQVAVTWPDMSRAGEVRVTSRSGRTGGYVTVTYHHHPAGQPVNARAGDLVAVGLADGCPEARAVVPYPVTFGGPSGPGEDWP